MPFHCFLAFMVPDEKSALNLEYPLYVMINFFLSIDKIFVWMNLSMDIFEFIMKLIGLLGCSDKCFSSFWNFWVNFIKYPSVSSLSCPSETQIMYMLIGQWCPTGLSSSNHLYYLLLFCYLECIISVYLSLVLLTIYSFRTNLLLSPCSKFFTS